MPRLLLALTLLFTACTAEVISGPRKPGPVTPEDPGLEFLPPANPDACSGCLEEKRGIGGQPFAPASSSSENEFVTIDPEGALVVDKQATGGSNRYLWVADTSLPGVVKIDLDTLKIAGRYRTGGASTSRTTVNALGEAFIGAREGGPQGKAGVTKILPHGQGCPDTNGDGAITTSTGADDVLAWGKDDCVAWHTETEGDIRGLAAQDIPGLQHENLCKAFDGQSKEFDPKAVTVEDQHYIWVGGTHGKMYKLDARTGKILITTKAPVPVYGMALSGDGRLWVGQGGGGFGFLDTTRCSSQAACDAATVCTQTCTTSSCAATCDGAIKASFTDVLPGYGITVDYKKRVWRSGYPDAGLMRYDPNAPPDQRLALGKVGGYGGGIAVDASGWVWAATLSGTVRVNAETLEGVAVAAPAKGIAVDTKGRVFAVQYDGAVHLITPGKGMDDHEVTKNAVPLKGVAYAYSDMTGVQTRLASGEPGWYRELFQPCNKGKVEWQFLTWEVEAPQGTWAMFNIRSADTVDDLKKATWYTVSCIAPPGGKGSAKIGTVSGKLLEVESRFIATGDLNKPETVVSARVKSFSVLHRCVKVE